MKLGDQEIGFANITVEPTKTETSASSKPTEGFTNELASLLGKMATTSVTTKSLM